MMHRAVVPRVAIETDMPMRFKEEGSALQRKDHVGILARRLWGFRQRVRDDGGLGIL